jgi:rfaE bifunctional protein nucleotidyltransferase chain/domain
VGKVINLNDFKFNNRYDLGYKVIFTNGCFDIIHAGHIKFLEAAKKVGGWNDWLIVGLNSDKSIRQIKGANRPIISQDLRVVVLEALEVVTNVVIFDEPTPEKLIKTIRPDFLIKGEDWNKDDIVGKDFVESYGGEVVRISFEVDISTSKIIEKIRKLK